MFDSEQRREAVDRLLAEHRELTARLSDPAAVSYTHLTLPTICSV